MGVDVGQVLSQTWAVFKERAWSLIGLYVVFFAIQMALFMAFGVMTGATGMMMGSAMDPATLGGGVILGTFIFYVIYFLITCAQSLSMSVKASPLRDVDMGEAIGIGFRLSLSLLGTYILLFLCYFVVALPIGLLIAAFAMMAESLVAIGAILALPLVIYLVCRVSLIAPVIAVEDVRNPITALRKSWSMTGGNVLTVFLSYFAAVALAIVPVAILVVAFGGSLYSAIQMDSVAGGVGAGIALVIAILVLMLVIGAAFTALVSVLHALLSGSEAESLESTFE